MDEAANRKCAMPAAVANAETRIHIHKVFVRNIQGRIPPIYTQSLKT